MYLMIADEADQDGKKEFLVYAGVFFPDVSVSKLTTEVDALRNKYGYREGDLLKSSPGTVPEYVSRDNHANIKNDILNLAAGNGCKICCYVVPHAIAKGQSHENRLKFGINTVLGKFDQFLREHNDPAGAAFFDRTEDFNQTSYLREIYEFGLPFGNKRQKLSRVVMIDNTSIGHSNLCSITDVVVGSFRFVVNEPEKDIVGAKLLKLLAKLMWCVTNDKGEQLVRERGICIRPMNVDVTDYEADIHSLISRLEKYAAT